MSLAAASMPRKAPPPIKAREHSGKVKAFSEKADSLTAKSEEWHFYHRKARDEQIIYNQCVKNLKLLEGRKE